jgi:hypothetical protein
MGSISVHVHIELGLHLMHASHPLLKDDYPHYPSLSYPLSAVTTDNGSIFDVLVIIGLKSTLSCLVGARLILIVHMICCNTSAPIDNFAYFLLFSILFFRYNTVKDELSFLNPVESIY